MKTLILFLIFSTIGYCLTDTEIVDCESDFEIKVKEKCEAIGRPCTFNSKTKKCFETYECSQAVEGKCQFPKNFTFYKCVPSGTGTNFECNQEPRTCSEFSSIVASATISGDIICIIGFLIYLEIIELNFCNLNYNLKKNIAQRGISEDPFSIKYSESEENIEIEIEGENNEEESFGQRRFLQKRNRGGKKN